MGGCPSTATACTGFLKQCGDLRPMMLTLEVNCANTCGPAVFSKLEHSLSSRLRTETNDAVGIRGIFGSFDAGLTMTEYMFKVPLQVDCEKLLEGEGIVAGKSRRPAPLSMIMFGPRHDTIAGQIETKVRTVVGESIRNVAGGSVVELVSCRVM
eukprot:TRINITY_DN4698_c0_g1_i2.p1 TRINITY_DN4698_c0_g1~~TRINITY_DN4698_c0_g1_i2.p1  ORF type:complete len:154 (+),score=15.94 TRINITY_DN4698_c0_g1_i2:99-560(+)